MVKCGNYQIGRSHNHFVHMPICSVHNDLCMLLSQVLPYSEVFIKALEVDSALFVLLLCRELNISVSLEHRGHTIYQ